jgi:hypothetical protein
MDDRRLIGWRADQRILVAVNKGKANRNEKNLVTKAENTMDNHDPLITSLPLREV